MCPALKEEPLKLILAPFFHYQRKGNIAWFSLFYIYLWGIQNLRIHSFFFSMRISYNLEHVIHQTKLKLKHVSKFHRSFTVFKNVLPSFYSLGRSCFIFHQTCTTCSSLETFQLFPKLAFNLYITSLHKHCIFVLVDST